MPDYETTFKGVQQMMVAHHIKQRVQYLIQVLSKFHEIWLNDKLL